MTSLKPISRALLTWYAKNARDLPWRRTLDPYAIWISEIMLQQTQVKTVIPFWTHWMRRFPDIQALSRAKKETVLKHWAGLGYYNRAMNIQCAARRILKEHGGIFPSDYGAILALPGIGRYTAGAIGSIAFNQPLPIVDGNVVRVLTRLLGIEENPKDPQITARLWNVAQSLVETASQSDTQETRNCSHLNQALMELGAIVCAPRDPDCVLCPIRKHCVAHLQNRTTEIPNRGPKSKLRSRVFAAFVVFHQRLFLVRKRSQTGINARLWEFPNIERFHDRDPIRNTVRECLGFVASEPKKLGTILHSITQNRIRLNVFYLETGHKTKANGAERWCSLKQLKQLPFPSAHQKIILMLETLSDPPLKKPRR